jgi:hypothetical protein
MEHLRPWKPKPYKKLGAGATIVQEASHFIHEMGNKLMVLMMRMEIRANNRKSHVAELKRRKLVRLKKLREMCARHDVIRRAHGARRAS